MRLDELTRETFQPHLETTFQTSVGDGQIVELKLIHIARLMERVTSKRLKREPFSLYFHGPETRPLPQGIYELSHPALGETPLPIFLVPVGREDGKFEYEAVFT